jgi:hypothetical protein
LSAMYPMISAPACLTVMPSGAVTLKSNFFFADAFVIAIYNADRGDNGYFLERGQVSLKLAARTPAAGLGRVVRAVGSCRPRRSYRCLCRLRGLRELRHPAVVWGRRRQLGVRLGQLLLRCNRTRGGREGGYGCGGQAGLGGLSALPEFFATLTAPPTLAAKIAGRIAV